jgi:flagellum-specific peptidoglycan hydrolase FlgJ
MTNAEFVKKHYNEAYEASKGSGIFVETLLGQSILETSSGKSQLSNKYNNYFGIKADSSWKGPSINMKTGEVFDGKKVTINSNFRVYDSFKESAKDYIKFLKENPRYAKAGVFNAKDYKEQIQAIKNAGYATGTEYVSSVVRIVSGITDDISDMASKYVEKSVKFVKGSIEDVKKNPFKVGIITALLMVSGYLLVTQTKIIKLKR